MRIKFVVVKQERTDNVRLIVQAAPQYRAVPARQTAAYRLHTKQGAEVRS
jgi:hypothetical protein